MKKPVLSCCQVIRSASRGVDLQFLSLWLMVWPDLLVPTAWAGATWTEIPLPIRVISEQHESRLIPTNIFYISLHILLDYCRGEAASKVLKLSSLICLCQSNWSWSLSFSSDGGVRSSPSTDQSWVLQSKIMYMYKQNSPYLFCSIRMHSDSRISCQDDLSHYQFYFKKLYFKHNFLCPFSLCCTGKQWKQIQPACIFISAKDVRVFSKAAQETKSLKCWPQRRNWYSGRRGLFWADVVHVCAYLVCLSSEETCT